MSDSNFPLSEQHYIKALELQEAENATHIFNASILYKQACTKIKMDDLDSAR